MVITRQQSIKNKQKLQSVSSGFGDSIGKNIYLYETSQLNISKATNDIKRFSRDLENKFKQRHPVVKVTCQISTYQQISSLEVSINLNQPINYRSNLLTINTNNISDSSRKGLLCVFARGTHHYVHSVLEKFLFCYIKPLNFTSGDLNRIFGSMILEVVKKKEYGGSIITYGVPTFTGGSLNAFVSNEVAECALGDSTEDVFTRGRAKEFFLNINDHLQNTFQIDFHQLIVKEIKFGESFLKLNRKNILQLKGSSESTLYFIFNLLLNVMSAEEPD